MITSQPQVKSSLFFGEKSLTSEPSVCVIVLNYENPEDTIDCLNSLLGLRYSRLKIVLCDNGSGDHSVRQFADWAENAKIYGKKLGYSIVGDNTSGPKNEKSCNGDPILYILDNKANLGYAAGMNVGLKFALKLKLFKYLWILNNDTVVAKDALFYLVKKMETDPAIGLCGSTILYAHAPRRVQALGGFLFNRAFGLSTQIGNGEIWSNELAQRYTENRVESQMFGVQGASVFVRKELLEKVGMMNEEYFLYCEEQDWAVRSRGGFKFGYASNSLVYHQEGKTTGSNSYQTKKSLKGDFYLTRSRLMFTRKYFPFFLPTVIGLHFLIAGKRFLTRQPLNSLLIITVSFIFLKKTKYVSSVSKLNPSTPFDRFLANKLFHVLFGQVE